MSGRIADIRATTRWVDRDEIFENDGKCIVRRLLGLNYEHIHLEGALIDEFESDIVLWVEEDAEFIIATLGDLEQRWEPGKAFTHYAHLGDGSLTFAAFSDGRNVQLRISLYPQLDVANDLTLSFIVGEKEYVAWWRSVASQLRRLAATDDR